MVSGGLEAILFKLMSIKGLIEMRKAIGWELFQEDENWIYTTQEDERVCLTCEEFGLNRVYGGIDVPIEFPDKIILEPTHVYPNIHITYPSLKGDCRCDLRWLDYMYALIERLGREMQEEAT